MESILGSTVLCELCSERSSVKEMSWYTVFGSKTLLCPLCVMYFKKNSPEAISPEKPLLSGQTQLPQWKSVPISGATPLAIGDYTIYLSASRDLKTPLQGEVPTAAAYLDNTWIKGLVLTNDSTYLPVSNGMRLMYANWPDYGVVPLDVVTLIVRWILEAWKGGDVVEVGCIGGHGRTGTMAALLCISEGMGWRDSMQYVRKEYCSKAIESVAQETMIQAYAESLQPD